MNNRRVADAFYEYSRRAVEESPFPVVEINGPDQRGDHFGARLANAVAEVFSRGYRRVIAVGSDCPELCDVDWQHVSTQLEAGAPVLGPTVDRDGTYLIGIAREQFDRSAFASLPWTTPAVLGALCRYLEERCVRGPTFLPARDDVNGHDDLFALLEDRSGAVPDLVIRLRELLTPGVYTFTRTTAVPGVHFCGRRSRGPPSRTEADVLGSSSRFLSC